jgi:hypothetical protein
MKRLATVEEIAQILRTSPAAIYTSRHRGQLPGALGLRAGRRILFDVDEVFREMRSRRDRNRLPATRSTGTASWMENPFV